MIKLIRVRREEPVYQFQGLLIGPPDPVLHKHAARHYDYVTNDGRWLVQPTEQTCGGPRWKVIDTYGLWVCETCTHNTEQHAELVSTLDVARIVIAEMTIAECHDDSPAVLMN